MKRRIFSMIMAVFLIISLVSVGAVTAYADEIYNSLTLYPTKCRVGRTVDVPVYAYTQDPFACMVLQPDYDKTTLELVDVVCDIAGVNFLFNGDPDNPQFIWYNTENVRLKEGSRYFT